MAGCLRAGPVTGRRWDGNEKPLCEVALVTGAIEESSAGLHTEFANRFVGGGVLTGDAAMEETLFLCKPELMAATGIHPIVTSEERPRIMIGNLAIGRLNCAAS
jgi:hypothetical protein